jgi:hypothetical protein
MRGTSEVKLFRLDEGGACEIPLNYDLLERTVQAGIERNLEEIFGVRLLQSEFKASGRHGGRMDTIGLDGFGCPVIIEYKRAANENIINQGLYYLDWLLEHKRDFEWLVMNRLGGGYADHVDWANPRLICVAPDFSKYDERAVRHIDRMIELVRFRWFGDDLLMLETLSRGSANTPGGRSSAAGSLWRAMNERTRKAEAREPEA